MFRHPYSRSICIALKDSLGSCRIGYNQRPIERVAVGSHQLGAVQKTRRHRGKKWINAQKPSIGSAEISSLEVMQRGFRVPFFLCVSERFTHGWCADGQPLLTESGIGKLADSSPPHIRDQ